MIVLIACPVINSELSAWTLVTSVVSNAPYTASQGFTVTFLLRLHSGLMSSATATQTDRGYTSLLHHLHRPSASTLAQLDGLQTSIAYYLAYGRKNQPNGQSPTPLAAATVGSSMFQFSDQMGAEAVNERLEMVMKAFRRAAHYKVHALLGNPDPANPSVPTPSSSSQGILSSIFSLPLESRLSTWIRDILNGLQGGSPVARFACLGGLVIGLEDLERQRAAREAGHTTDVDGKGEVDEVVVVRRRSRGQVEDETIVALAEVMGAYPLPSSIQPTDDGVSSSGWESEFAQNISGMTGRGKFVVLVAQICHA